MIYKNFRLNITIRVLCIVALALALAFVIVERPMFFALSTIIVLLVVSVISLIRYIDKSNKDLTHFLLSIRQGAFTEFYTSGNRGKQYEQLSGALNDIVTEFSKLNLEKELHYQYLQTLNENISVAILSFDAAGKLMMINPAAKKLLNDPSFSTLHDFNAIDPELYISIKNIQPEQRKVIQVFIGEDQYQLSIQAKEIVLNGKPVRIILLQNLNHELEEKEIEAWHQLMRVLTHEIMNSVTPIASLTTAVESILKHPDGTRKDFSTLNEDQVDDIFSSLSTISSRSKGLMNFVKVYKAYAKPIHAQFESVDVRGIVNRVAALLAADLQALGIQLIINNPATIVYAKTDIALMEQVLINLVKNAMDAVAHDGTGIITLNTGTKANRVTIAIADNGIGIDAEILSRIFVPFFTTKSKGSGIGLSLSRQIMKLHGGGIQVHTSEKGSIFTLVW
jgi:nitrogen fixation/metabolism regulation signal transduction histidine kinase